jgi:uncharacterized protein (TIGR02444 family)
MSEADSAAGSPFWRFSLGFYRRAGVAEACIALQEQAGVDVNLLLFLLWHARMRRALSAAEVAALETRVAPWRAMTVIPLRSVRRALKLPPELVAPGTAEVFRTRIKAVELEAERLQQEAMYEAARASPMGHELSSAAEAARINIESYAAMAHATFPSTATQTLLAAFDHMTT